MTSTVCVGWYVDRSVWERFVSYVRGRYGDPDAYIAREVETAMREYADKDDYAELEAKIDRLLNALGHSSSVLREKKENGSGSSVKVNRRVAKTAREDFRSFVDRETDERPGDVLTRALSERMDGGRSRRLSEKIDRLLPETEAIASEIDPDEKGRMGVVKRRTIAACKEIREKHTVDGVTGILAKDVDRVVSESLGIETDTTIEKYRGRIADRLGYDFHPNNSDLLIPEHVADELRAGRSDGPAAEWKPYDELSREEKVEGIRVEGARRAVKNGGKGKLRTNDVVGGFLGRPSSSHAGDLLGEVATGNGFKIRESGEYREVLVDVDRVDPEITNMAYAHKKNLPKARKEARSKRENPGETSRGSGSKTEKPAIDTGSTWEQLEAAEIGEALTDGGDSDE